jgi:hypothetical protein
MGIHRYSPAAANQHRNSENTTFQVSSGRKGISRCVESRRAPNALFAKRKKKKSGTAHLSSNHRRDEAAATAAVRASLGADTAKVGCACEDLTNEGGVRCVCGSYMTYQFRYSTRGCHSYCAQRPLPLDARCAVLAGCTTVLVLQNVNVYIDGCASLPGCAGRVIITVAGMDGWTMDHGTSPAIAWARKSTFRFVSRLGNRKSESKIMFLVLH